MYNDKKLNLTAIGQAVKEARESRNLTRETVAEMLELGPVILCLSKIRDSTQVCKSFMKS